MIVNEIKPDTIPTWKAEFLRKEHTNVVLEKIKAEIDQKQYDFMANKDYDEGIRFGLLLAYQIIDKYIEGSENE